MTDDLEVARRELEIIVGRHGWQITGGQDKGRVVEFRVAKRKSWGSSL